MAANVYLATRGSYLLGRPAWLLNRFFLIRIGGFCVVGTGESRPGKADDSVETSIAEVAQ